jgi:hypothetical protein
MEILRAGREKGAAQPSYLRRKTDARPSPEASRKAGMTSRDQWSMGQKREKTPKRCRKSRLHDFGLLSFDP